MSQCLPQRYAKHLCKSATLNGELARWLRFQLHTEIPRSMSAGSRTATTHFGTRCRGRTRAWATHNESVQRRHAVRACTDYAIDTSRSIDFLTIFGHGTGGYQAIGAGQPFNQSGTLSLWYQNITRPGQSHLVGPAESLIRRLNGVLSPNATMLLAGCNVGDGGQGDGLLTTVSTALNNRSVQGFENSVFWWTGALVGYLKTAVGSSVSSSFSFYTI